MLSKYFKPFIGKCRGCGAQVAILRTVNGKTISVKTTSLSEQETIDIKRGVNFFYNPTRHTYHLATCPAARDIEKAKYNVTIDNRYGERDEE